VASDSATASYNICYPILLVLYIRRSVCTLSLCLFVLAGSPTVVPARLLFAREPVLGLCFFVSVASDSAAASYNMCYPIPIVFSYP